jgi:hypothetical protein
MAFEAMKQQEGQVWCAPLANAELDRDGDRIPQGRTYALIRGTKR